MTRTFKADTLCDECFPFQRYYKMFISNKRDLSKLGDVIDGSYVNRDETRATLGVSIRGRESRVCARRACVRVCQYIYRCAHHDTMTNRSLLCSNRSSMSCTVKWAPPSSFVRSALRTTKTSRSNPAVTSCALPVSRPGRYCDEQRLER